MPIIHFLGIVQRLVLVQSLVYIACIFLSAPIVITALKVLLAKPEECGARTDVTEEEIMALAKSQAKQECKLLNGGKKHGNCN